MKLKLILGGAILSLPVLLLATACGLGLLHISDWLYRLDIRWLDIEATSGLAKQEILSNYHAVMQYLSPFSRSAFSLPSLKFSAEGAAHFADTKRIFLGVYFAGGLSGALLMVLKKAKLLGRIVCRSAGIATLVLPGIILAAMALDFDTAFVVFHKLFFPGATNWLFDYATDPIIYILPAAFFLHCAVFIALCWAVAGALLLWAGRKTTPKITMQPQAEKELATV